MNNWEKMAKANRKIQTSPDIGCDILEKEFIKKYLRKSQNVLDIGCGDGIATCEFALRVKHIDAIEPAPTLLQSAIKQAQKNKIINIKFQKGSLFDIGKIYRGRRFQVIILKRIIINLKDWREQQKALHEITKIMRRGDLLLLSEGFEDTFNNLQELRFRHGLYKDKVVKFNKFLDREKFYSFIEKDFKILEQQNLGAYYFISHFLYPLMIKPKEPVYSAKINMIAANINLKEKLLEEYGYINFYALKKK